MLVLFTDLLDDIRLAIKGIRESIASKQNKTWKRLGSTAGTLNLSLSGYTELAVYVKFGGVQVGQNIPVSLIPSSGSITAYVGYYGGTIYVQITKTSAKITQQPAGYTGTLIIYAR